MYIYIYIYMYTVAFRWDRLHRLSDGVGTSDVFTEGPHIHCALPRFVLTAHMLPHCYYWITITINYYYYYYYHYYYY